MAEVQLQNADYIVPASLINLPTTLAAGSTAYSNVIKTQGYDDIAVSILSSQNGILSIQRYLDSAATMPQGIAQSTTIVAGTQATLNVLADGLAFEYIQISISNIGGTSATLNNLKVIFSPNEAGGFNSVSLSAALPAGNNTIGGIFDAYASPTTATWNSSTTLNTALTSTTSGYDTVVVTVVPSGTMTAGQLVFEVYDGATWLPVKGARTNSYATDLTFNLASSATTAWQFSVGGFPQFRIRLGTAITGSGSILVTQVTSSAPDVSMVTVGLDPSQPLPAGTNTIGNVTLNAGSSTIGSVSMAASTSGGSSAFFAAAQNNTVTAVKTSAGNVYGFTFQNPNASAAYVQFFDLATGSVTLGTTTPKLSYWVPAGGSYDFVCTDEAKISFATAISIASTTTSNGSTANATGLLVNLLYK